MTRQRDPRGVLTKSIISMLANNATVDEIITAHPNRSEKSIRARVSQLRNRHAHDLLRNLDATTIKALNEAVAKHNRRVSPPRGVLTKSIVVMLANNATTKEIIEAHPGRSRATMYPMIANLRKKYGHEIKISLHEEAINEIYDAAEKRGMRMPDLVAKLLNVLAHDKLIDGILDDGDDT